MKKVFFPDFSYSHHWAKEKEKRLGGGSRLHFALKTFLADIHLMH